MVESTAEDGAAFPLGPSAQAKALREANEKLVLATVRAQSAEDELRKAARHKDEFLAMFGHEMRNPLVPIRNAAEILRGIADADPRLVVIHDMLMRQVGHITRLLDDLLDISLISRGALRIHFSPVEVGDVLRRAAEAAAPLVKRKHHRFRSELPATAVWVEGDPVRLSQVFENLLTYAAKYTEDGGEIVLTLEIADQSALIRVRDNGLGISPDMRARIFELFVQDARAADRSEGGLGIGLALVRNLVELHHGTLEAASEGEGKGTEFLVRLPLLPQVSLPAVETMRPKPGQCAGRVMVVDDDVDAGESTTMLLRMYGYDVESATDLESALQVGQAFRPQVVLMDISMPRADGYEVARRLRAVTEPGRHIDYIALSGFGALKDFQRSEQEGFLHHKVKPVDPTEIVRLLQQAIRAAGTSDGQIRPA